MSTTRKNFTGAEIFNGFNSAWEDGRQKAIDKTHAKQAAIKSEEHPAYTARVDRTWDGETLETLIDMPNKADRENEVIRQAKTILYSRMITRGVEITSPQAMTEFLELELAQEEQEVFGVVFLDTRHRVIEFRRMFYGTIDGASVHPREVAKAALKLNAAAVIFAHNHPSGVAEPSGADIAITEKLKTALALFEVRTLDHIIIGSLGDTVSLAQRGEV